jgi:hypothetical protein
MKNSSETAPSASASEPAIIERLAKRHGFSVDAVRVMAVAIARGDRRMAQFDHHEFGGRGQWMRGGMLMIGDMFNSDLKARVSALCDDLASAPTAAAATHASPGDWWPNGLGRPDSAGDQNGIRYAYFVGARRLIIQRDGIVSMFDTADHRISGAAQQQGHRTSLTLTSQHGAVDLSDLHRI